MVAFSFGVVAGVASVLLVMKYGPVVWSGMKDKIDGGR